jgi:hypothetical protein
MCEIRPSSAQRDASHNPAEDWPAGDEPTGQNDDEMSPTQANWKDSIRAPAL